MKFLIVLALVAFAAADVSHLFKNQNNYLPPSQEYLPALNQPEQQYTTSSSAQQQGSYNNGPAPSAAFAEIATTQNRGFARPASIYGAPGFGVSAPSAQISSSIASSGYEAGISNSYLAPTAPAFQGPVEHSYVSPPAIQPTFAPFIQQTYTPAIQQTYSPIQQTYRPAIQPTYSAPIQQTYIPAVQPTYSAPIQQTYIPAVQPTYSAPIQQYRPVQPTYSAPFSSQGSYSTSFPKAVTTPFSSFSGPTTVELISEPAPAHSFESDGYHYRNPNQY